MSEHQSISPHPPLAPSAAQKAHSTDPSAELASPTLIKLAISCLKRIIADLDVVFFEMHLQMSQARADLAHAITLAQNPEGRRRLGASQWQLMLVEDDRDGVLKQKEKLSWMIEKLEKGDMTAPKAGVEELLEKLAALGYEGEAT